MNRSTNLYAAGAIVFVICGSVLAWLNLQSASDSHADAAGNLQRMESMVEDIAYLRDQASTAELLGERPKQEIRPWVERAARAGISAPSNFMVSPLRPIPKSSYSQEDVAITLQDVNLRQVVKYLTDSNDSTEYTPTVIDLKPTSIKNAKVAEQERWTANLILTRLIYTAINQSGEK